MADLLNQSAGKQQVTDRAINACVADLQKMSQSKSQADFEKKVSNVTKALTDAVGVLEMFKSGKADPGAIFEGAMQLFSSIATIAGGPLGIVFAGAGQVLAAVFSADMFGSGQKESLPSQVYKMATKALQEFDMKQLSSRVEGWGAVAKELISELKRQQASSSYSGFEPWRFDDFIELMGELSLRIAPTIPFKTTFECVRRGIREGYIPFQPSLSATGDLKYEPESPHYVKIWLDDVIENSELATHPLTSAEEFQPFKDSITCMSLYAKISTCYYMLLTWHMTLSNNPKEVNDIEGKLNDAKQAARDMLGYLSDKSLLSTIEGLINGKLLIMEAYLCDAGVVQYVERFRKGIELSATEYSLKDIQKAAVKMSSLCEVKLYISPSCYQAADRGDEHYIGITNSTRWPVNVFCGETGDHINELRFNTIIGDGASYKHKCTSAWKGWFFSSGGVFCVDNDSAKCIEEIKEGTIISFALSNPMLDRRKIRVEVVNSITSKGLAWEMLFDHYDRAKFFTHKGQVCFVRGSIHEGKKNGCRVWSYSIEEFDKKKLQHNFTDSVTPFVEAKYKDQIP